MPTPKKDFENWMAGWHVTNIDGKWLTAFKMASVRGETPGELILFLRQAPRIWHAFYRERATGSGTTPLAALTGGLGDALSTDAEMRAYLKLVLAAPDKFIAQFDGLYAAVDQCHSEAESQD